AHDLHEDSERPTHAALNTAARSLRIGTGSAQIREDRRTHKHRRQTEYHKRQPGPEHAAKTVNAMREIGRWRDHRFLARSRAVHRAVVGPYRRNSWRVYTPPPLAVA